MHPRRSPRVLPAFLGRWLHRRRQPLATHQIFPSIRQSPPCGCPRCGTSPRSWRLLSNTRQTRARYRPLRLLSAKLFEQGGDIGGEHRHRADRPPRNLTRGNARENPDRATGGHKTVPIGGKSAGRRPSPLASNRGGPATACCCPYLGYVTSSCPALSTTSDLGHPLAGTQTRTGLERSQTAHYLDRPGGHSRPGGGPPPRCSPRPDSVTCRCRSSWGHRKSGNHSRPAVVTGVPAIQRGATPIARRQSPTRFRSEGSIDCSGNHLREPPCKLPQAPWGTSRYGFRSSAA
jgi:hypothetical protein